ncbi:hypothetical protein [Leptospira phage LE3]|uniref:DUF6908 domain-containing protein n=2 Tax=Nylescharonvirus TaxID=2843431 RepID=A0A343LEF3_9CAUD|nr:hypothetical protein HWB33_gp52 [Leptospira phage LE3]YP_009835525.1 hypothetical protein HWB34_gp50 [Leptospira phage LE4]ATN94942.1 hypothetical protein [Leptospira phage LE3]ATN95063.1 hypothetical protein [Leptospira phage LE4]
MDAIKQIIKAKGLSKENNHCKIKNPPYMDLTIEILPNDCVSVAHYSKQNGDLMADPEMIFRVAKVWLTDKDGNHDIQIDEIWHPIYYKNDFMGVEHDCTDKPGFQLNTNFPKIWNKNLKSQGFVKIAKKG